jgi:hypothetical protein
MTRKHFVALARALREDAAHLATGEPFDYTAAPRWEQGAYDQWNTTVLATARTLSDLSGFDLNGNRRFDRERFLSACGFVGGVR